MCVHGLEAEKVALLRRRDGKETVIHKECFGRVYDQKIGLLSARVSHERRG